MNNFITAKQFLNQSEKVQSELIKWWKPQIGDIYTCSNSNYVKVIDEDVLAEYEINGSLKETIYCFNSKEDIVLPLLQIHHLIQFIEEETGGKIEIEYVEHEKILITIIELIYDECFKKVILKEEYLCDLLQALWQVVIKSIEDN